MGDIFEIDYNEIFNVMDEKSNFAKKWFIDKEIMDTKQLEVFNEEGDNFIVTGCAGSGKTILAIHRLFKNLAKEEKDFDSYLFTIYTKALLTFIKDGFDIFLQENEKEKMLFDFNLSTLNIDYIYNIEKSHDFDKLKKYLIIDEYQDIKKSIFGKLIGNSENIMLFGDDEQQLYSEDTMNLDSIKEVIECSGHKKLKEFNLDITYRLPYEVAEFAQQIIKTEIVNKCKKGKSIKYKPNIIECNNLNEQIEFIAKEVLEKDLMDVGVLIHDNKNVLIFYRELTIKINELCEKLTAKEKPSIFKKYKSDSNLNFKKNNSITIITLHSSKGTEFENVFIPKCDKDSIYSDDLNYDKALFVACTRTNKNLYITYEKSIGLTEYMETIRKETYNRYKYDSGVIKKLD